MAWSRAVDDALAHFSKLTPEFSPSDRSVIMSNPQPSAVGGGVHSVVALDMNHLISVRRRTRARRGLFL